MSLSAERTVIRGQRPLLVLLLALAVCSSPLAAAGGGIQAQARGTGAKLIVAAAADLVFALRQIAPLFEQEHKVKVTLSFGSTGQLAQQIQHGSPVEVFFAASPLS